jgi:hypothetical protein
MKNEILDARNNPQPINTWLEWPKSSQTSELDEAERIERANKDEAILALLGRLALVYWRPDFAPSQAKQLYLQYLEDLREFPIAAVSEAIQNFRRNGENRFFPTCGQLRDLIVKPYSWESKRDRMKGLYDIANDEMQKRVEVTRARLNSSSPQRRIAAV